PAALPLKKDSVISIVDGPELSAEEKDGYERNASEHKAAEVGATSAWVQGEGRITYEFSVPLASLEKVGGATTERIQFNIGVNDYDPADARLGVSLVTWRPSWST